ncbi:MAG: hypothetical protein WA823_16610 [Candidatus Acidiferrales bacterium]
MLAKCVVCMGTGKCPACGAPDGASDVTDWLGDILLAPAKKPHE